MDKALIIRASQMVASSDIEMIRLGVSIIEEMKLGTLETMEIIDKNLDKKLFRYNIDMFDGDIEIMEGGERKIRMITGKTGMQAFEKALKEKFFEYYGREDKTDARQ